jgi:hypothetical protein
MVVDKNFPIVSMFVCECGDKGNVENTPPFMSANGTSN